MTDPYKVLKVSKNCTDDELKSAYKELAQKYSPNAYAGNPLSDLAEQKMKEIDEAYDTIMQERRAPKESTESSSSTSSDNSSDTQSHQTSGSSNYTDIRNMINRGRVADAEDILNGIPTNDRNAEWNFLKGTIFYSKGWLEEAAKHFDQAVRMEPFNREYKAAYDRIVYQRGGGMYGRPQQGGQQGQMGCSICDMCV